MKDLHARVAEAVRLFWGTRRRQANAQGGNTGRRDQGERTAVTGGAHIDGFVRLVGDLLVESGLPRAAVFAKTKGRSRPTKLPGFFRATKDWDLLVVDGGQLVASMEFKSQVGPSFGNNCNNRVEEAVGNATDLWTAYRDGAFAPSAKPWLGYFMLLEEAPGSVAPVKTPEPYFKVRSGSSGIPGRLRSGCAGERSPPTH